MNPKKSPISPHLPLSPADSTRKRPSPSFEPSTSKIPPPTTPHATSFSVPEHSRGSKGGAGGGPTISRSIQACNRCRARKTRCDQQFPSCSACLKANVECVGIDAATGREIPRSYVDWLEKRVKHLEEELKLEQEGPKEDEMIDPQLQQPVPQAAEGFSGTTAGEVEGSQDGNSRDQKNGESKALHLRPDIENLVNQVGLVGVQGTSAPGFMGGSSGISFARLMFTAVKMTSKDSQQNANTPSIHLNRIPTPDPVVSSTAIPRSRQRASPCPFPSRDSAEKLLETYFQQANPQFPILSRSTFGAVFHRVCDRVEVEGADASGNLTQNGGPINVDRIQHSANLYFAFMCFAIASAMSQCTENMPERYHAAAMQHMDSLFSSASLLNNRLDSLKGVLLLAVYSMMRPAAPGVWYVLGTALRLAVDMGLHQENPSKAEKLYDQVTLDERRRLFWCTYSLDRQVCVYIGRPFGISDDAIKTPFPIDVDDECITTNGIRHQGIGIKSSRTVSLHMFQIRQLQSEIQRILYQASEIPRRFQSLNSWQQDMEARLQHWCDTAPKNQGEAGCGFNLSFIDLNYQQTRLLLYGLCPVVPLPTAESFEIIADSGSKIIKAYRHLHREKSINYTWLACHNLFMAGTSYLCALWQSHDVRAATTIDQIDFHTLACVDVLSSMIERCPAAQTCRNIFESLATSTVKLCSTEYATLRLHSSIPNHNSNNNYPRPAKRFRTESSHPEWTPPDNPNTGQYRPPTPSQHPASLANLLHHPSPPPMQQQDLSYRHYDIAYAHPLAQHHHHSGDIDPLFRPSFVDEHQQHQVIGMTAGMDGSRLFEMIQEVGSGGAMGFDFEGAWGLDLWTPDAGAVL